MRPPGLLALAVTLYGLPAAAQSRPAPLPVGDGPGYVLDVMAAARPHTASIRGCYQRAGGSEAVWRRVRSVSLVLSADGVVRDVRVDPLDARARRLRACLAPIVRTWRLRPPAERVDVRLVYPANEIRLALGQLR